MSAILSEASAKLKTFFYAKSTVYVSHCFRATCKRNLKHISIGESSIEFRCEELKNMLNRLNKPFSILLSILYKNYILHKSCAAYTSEISARL